MTDAQDHVHSYVRGTSNGPTQTSEGVDWRGKPVVKRWHVEYWAEVCQCGDLKSRGEHTVEEPM